MRQRRSAPLLLRSPFPRSPHRRRRCSPVILMQAPRSHTPHLIQRGKPKYQFQTLGKHSAPPRTAHAHPSQRCIHTHTHTAHSHRAHTLSPSPSRNRGGASASLHIHRPSSPYSRLGREGGRDAVVARGWRAALCRRRREEEAPATQLVGRGKAEAPVKLPGRCQNSVRRGS